VRKPFGQQKGTVERAIANMERTKKISEAFRQVLFQRNITIKQLGALMNYPYPRVWSLFAGDKMSFKEEHICNIERALGVKLCRETFKIKGEL
jgi:predicted transcriptional regulator